MIKNRLYITDLDGTLLQDDGTLSEFSRSALQQIIDSGVVFTVASARSVFSMQDILKGLTIELPIISINGGYISDLATGSHYTVNQIRPVVAKNLLKLIIDNGFAPWVSTFDGQRDRLYYNKIINGGMAWYLEDRREAEDIRLQYLDDIWDSLSDQVICLIVMGRAEPLAELRTVIEKQHGPHLMTQFYENRYSPGWHWLSIHDAGSTKGRAIQTLVDRWGLQDFELVVFGDAENDIEMFQEATRAIAVANAEKTLKPHATEIIGKNSDDSVVRFILEDQEIQYRNLRN